MNKKCQVNLSTNSFPRLNEFQKCGGCGLYGNDCMCQSTKCGKKAKFTLHDIPMCEECYHEAKKRLGL